MNGADRHFQELLKTSHAGQVTPSLRIRRAAISELHELEPLAAKRSQTQAELIPGLIRREIEQDKTSPRASVEMVEITAFRLLLTHLLRPIVTGQAMTEQAFDGIVEEVKKQKACGGGPAQRSPIAALSNRELPSAALAVSYEKKVLFSSPIPNMGEQLRRPQAASPGLAPGGARVPRAFPGLMA